MKYHSKILIILLAFAFLSCNSNSNTDKTDAVSESSMGPRKVEMKQNDSGHYRLFVNGEEFYIQGAGLEFGDKQALAKHGANSFRTWRTDNAQEVLDEAEELGLMVLMGIEVGRERHGKDYNDEVWVAQQKEEIKAQVLRFKDHPALLGWGIGNELNLRYTNKKVWDAVNDISIMIHEIDGNHPTTTMLAGIGSNEIDYMAENATDLDFISIQMYGDIINLPQRIADAGYEGPYVVTEWGATGHWEVGKTEWGAPIEQNSSEKAASIKERYEVAILSDQANCMGSYVFLWGQKQERTPTWYGLFTEKKEETQPIDVMHYFWNENAYPDNQAPQLSNVLLNGMVASKNVKSSVNAEMILSYTIEDPDGDDLNIRFEVMRESIDLGDGGDHESTPETFDSLMISSEGGQVVFNAPAEKGEYRAFLYVLDGNNHAATVNIPFLIE